ncbi:MAG: transcriptional regulator [Betaproteobacteria bacterium HGW-Betaproteobacteria-8]|nr:MAG: transcriptional regulator [Betaproteobacteria bacterium HGW-Betaproteobacteria-8]
MTLTEEIRQRLQSLSPARLDLEDESTSHAGHKGNTGGGHFKLHIVSSQFCGKSQIIRHRLIYQALAGMIPQRIHALSIQAVATDETV